MSQRSQIQRSQIQDSTFLVQAVGLSVRQGDRLLLDAVDVRVSPREIVTLVGLNGSGKSTLIRTLLGLVKPVSGRVIQKPGLCIGYSPQHLRMDRTLPMSVDGFLAIGAQTSRQRRADVLREVGADNILTQPVADISGGELHRVMLARALLREPELLVLDEPMAGVDLAGQSDLYQLIADVRDRYGCGVLLVSHDLHVVMAATDWVVCLNHHVCCTGHPETVTTHPEFVALFGQRVSAVLAVYPHHHDHTHDSEGNVVPIGHDPGTGAGAAH